ncbi:hypothetical protein HELRODRAFT_151832, partial [Helobdella robusta]|uniref:Helicase ATP-binding domain-containing protein n=1 Tax=Helobdella robusta TaxID=6412 RepID=T1EKM2_HELRO
HSNSNRENFRSVSEIPKKFRHIFNFSNFNYLQSEIFDHALYKDEPLVISAPTGSGKTVIFELAIVRLILLKESRQISNFKIVYMAPIKALVSEKFNEWQAKLSPLGLNCCELTGDSEIEDYSELRGVHVILTTPEKWDFMTRRWRENRSFVQLVKLFLIDEVHTINDDTRGATLEAVVNRM